MYLKSIDFNQIHHRPFR
uniref:Uncharacterized protein n=1 Tax=Anguilla anguilla TaxID=7936 RepID=A0A0E9UXR0_ANGAN